jgi:hypothetical protein
MANAGFSAHSIRHLLCLQSRVNKTKKKERMNDFFAPPLHSHSFLREVFMPRSRPVDQ